MGLEADRAPERAELQHEPGRPERRQPVLVAPVPAQGRGVEERGRVEARHVERRRARPPQQCALLRARQRLGSRPARCASPSSPTFTQICTRSRRCWRQSTPTESTRSGASATSSATGRGRTSASALVRERASLCLAGNHDLAVLGRLDLEVFADEAGVAAAWTRTVLDADAATLPRLSGLEPRAVEGVDARARQPARPRLGVRALRTPPRTQRSRSSREPLILVGHSHIALALASAGSGVAGGKAPAGNGDRARRAAGTSSTRARSASRGTATPARPGS